MCHLGLVHSFPVPVSSNRVFAGLGYHNCPPQIGQVSFLVRCRFVDLGFFVVPTGFSR
jgi:hypothetical protein